MHKALETCFPICASVIGIVIIGCIDYLTGIELRVYPLYFVPVALGGWWVGRLGAFLLAAFSSVTWAFTNYWAGQHYTASYYWIWNFLIHGGGSLGVVFLVASVRRRFELERSLSHTDPLTTLPNTRAFYECVEQILAASRRNQRPFALAISVGSCFERFLISFQFVDR